MRLAGVLFVRKEEEVNLPHAAYAQRRTSLYKQLTSADKLISRAVYPSVAGFAGLARRFRIIRRSRLVTLTV